MFGSGLRLTAAGPGPSSLSRGPTKPVYHDSLYRNRSHNLVARKSIQAYREKLRSLVDRDRRQAQSGKKDPGESLVPPRSVVPLSTRDAGPLDEVVPLNDWRASERSRARARRDRRRDRLGDWEKKAEQLHVYQCVESLVFLQTITETEKETMTIDSERCKRCGGLYQTDPITNLSICQICHHVVSRLFVQEDGATDVLILRSGVSGTNTNARKRKRGECTTFLGDEASKALLQTVLPKTRRLPFDPRF